MDVIYPLHLVSYMPGNVVQGASDTHVLYCCKFRNVILHVDFIDFTTNDRTCGKQKLLAYLAQNVSKDAFTGNSVTQLARGWHRVHCA